MIGRADAAPATGVGLVIAVARLACRSGAARGAVAAAGWASRGLFAAAWGGAAGVSPCRYSVPARAAAPRPVQMPPKPSSAARCDLATGAELVVTAGME